VPVNLFEFSALQKKFQTKLFTDCLSHQNINKKKRFMMQEVLIAYRKDSFCRLPSSFGMLPLKLHPATILKKHTAKKFISKSVW
jgi:hypothetical protein